VRGFTLLEALVSVTLSLLVIGAAIPLMTTNSAVAVAAPEMADEQQRARAAADALARDLALAGAGMSLGPHAGGLVRAFAPIVPRKMGQSGADPFTSARNDALTIVYVPLTNAQGLLAQPMTSPLDPMAIDGSIGCPLFTQVCGLQQGSTALLFDAAGRFDLVSILAIQPGVATIEHRQQNPPDFVYAQGAGVAEAETHTYYFDSVALQLRHYDGAQTDVPVIDNVVDAAFEYFGDPDPPALPRPPAGVANCLYDASGARLPGITLASNGTSLVPLPLSLFTDGPWCGGGSFRYDADLLRIRLVRVRLSVQVGNLMMRGTTAAFRNAGRGRSALRNVPDYTLRFDVAPRNLNPAK
jgi:type II secretory pathway pseudopilin PulG